MEGSSILDFKIRMVLIQKFISAPQKNGFNSIISGPNKPVLSWALEFMIPLHLLIK